MNSNAHKQRGFTLLEMMVVLVILGILASLVVPSLMGNKDKADHQKAVSDIVALENALDMYKLDNYRYPLTAQGLKALVEKPTASPIPENYNAKGYIKRLPQDPWVMSICWLALVNTAITIFSPQVRTVNPAPLTTLLTGNWAKRNNRNEAEGIHATGGHSGADDYRAWRLAGDDDLRATK